MFDWLYLALCCVMVGAVIGLTVLLYKNFGKNSEIRKTVSAAAGLFVLCLVLEAFVFNWMHFTSYAADRLPSGEQENLVTDDSGNITVTYVFPDSPVEYLYVDAKTTDDGKDHNSAPRMAEDYDGTSNEVAVYIKIWDNANASGLSLSKRIVVHKVERSHYIKLNLTPEVRKVSVNLKVSDSYSQPELVDLKFNTKVPMMFSWGRMLALFAFLFAAFILRPTGALWRKKSFSKAWTRGVAAALACALTFGALASTIYINGAQDNNYLSHHGPYPPPAEANTTGELGLGDAPEFLVNMENPYDSETRKQQKEYYRWDTAYFQGKYYVYFGVVPCVLTFLPYRLITGSDMSNPASFLIFAAIFAAAAFLLVLLIRKRFAPGMPFIFALLFASGSVFGSAVLLAKHADIYCIPIMSALAFAVTGLLLWLYSVKKDGSVSVMPALFGSLSMALVAGCRPPVFLAAALAVPIYYRPIFKDRTLVSKKGVLPTIALVFPMFVVAGALMYYNYARFGSPFDFGANYNLTNNDMTVRGFRPGRLGTALFAYFIDLPDTWINFPFIRYATFADGSYQGTTIYFSTFGSVFAWPLIMPALAGLARRGFSSLKKNRLLLPWIIMLCAGVLIVIVDTQVAGVLSRYYCDMLFLMFGASLMLIASLYPDDRSAVSGDEPDGSAAGLTAEHTKLNTLMYIAFAATAIYSLIFIFVDDTSSIVYYRPVIFNYVKTLVAFWL